MSQTTTTTTTREYNAEGFLVKETTVTTVEEEPTPVPSRA